MVMSYVWALLVGVSVVCAAVTGQMGALSGAVMQGAQSGITLAISIAGSLCLWAGIGRAMERLGIAAALARILQPLLHRLFPSTGQDAGLAGALSANICANLLGLGNAATPSGRPQPRCGIGRAVPPDCAEHRLHPVDSRQRSRRAQQPGLRCPL
jgi:spore maturation protein A